MISAVLDITVILPDILKDVSGHDVPEGVEEELREDKEAGADRRDTGHPETIGAPGEIGVVDKPRVAGYSSSHHNSATTRGTQNGRRGLERGPTLGYWALRSTFTK